jgi:hypothetical protein
MKSSFPSLVLFLPLFCSCQLNSIPSSYPGLLASRTRLDYCCTSILVYAAEHFFITTLHGSRRKHSLYCWRGVFTAPVPNNRRPIVARFGSRGNVFTESLSSNGYTRQNIIHRILKRSVALNILYNVSGYSISSEHQLYTVTPLKTPFG